jgi:hypothetical protein
MLVITGCSSKDEGFLVVSELPLEEAAKKLGLVFYDLPDMVDCDGNVADRQFFAATRVSVDDIREGIRRYDETGRGVWEIWTQELVQDVNLSKVVCW